MNHSLLALSTLIMGSLSLSPLIVIETYLVSSESSGNVKKLDDNTVLKSYISKPDVTESLSSFLLAQSPLALTDVAITDILVGAGDSGWSGSGDCDRYKRTFSEGGEYADLRRVDNEWRLTSSASASRFSVDGDVITLVDGRNRGQPNNYPPRSLELTSVTESRIDFVRTSGEADFLVNCSISSTQRSNTRQSTASSNAGMSGRILRTQGSLDSGDEQFSDGSFYDSHSFSGRAGQRISIQLNSNVFDTYLLLYDPNGQKISENDDRSQEDINSSITATLTVDGTYSVIANSYDSSGRGDYILTVTDVDDSSATPMATNTDSNSITTSPRDGFYRYEEDGLFSIEYPEDWYVDQSSDNRVVFYSQQPPTRGGGDFPSNLVKTEVYIQSTSFEEAVQSLRNSSSRGRNTEVLTRQGSLTVGGREAFRAWFADGVHSTDYVVTLVRYSDTQVAHIVSYTASGATWAVPTIQDIHWSFRAL